MPKQKERWETRKKAQKIVQEYDKQSLASMNTDDGLEVNSHLCAECLENFYITRLKMTGLDV
jgi:hypothetical protein